MQRLVWFSLLESTLIYTNPTGFCSVSPVGPAMPVMPIAKSVSAFFRIPLDGLSHGVVCVEDRGADQA